MYGSGLGALHAPVPAAPAHPGDTASLPQLPHLRQNNYPYKPRFLPQVFSSQRVSATKSIVFEKVAPLDATARSGSSTASFDGTTTAEKRAREARFAATTTSVLDVAHAEKPVLHFNVFCKEGVPESPHEAFRHRNMHIYYHVSDGTMEMHEPRQDNAGLMQGPQMRRHLVPRFPPGVPSMPRPDEGAASGDHEYFDWRDLNVGNDLNIYGRVYHIYDADGFTRRWYEGEKGISLAPAEELPSDPVAEKLLAASKSGGKVDKGHGKVMFPQKMYQEARLGKFIRDPVARHKFQMHDGKVLKFDCLWDDSSKDYGDEHHLVLQFFLADDHAEIRLVHSNNNGRDRVPTLLRKGPLPKDWAAARDASPAEKPELFVHPKDIRVGSSLSVFGRTLHIRACDDWTREWYASPEAAAAYGVEVQPENEHVVEVPPPLPTFVVPPHTGIGSEEDSMQSCYTFNVKPLKKNLTQWARNDGVVFRYHARLASDNVLDAPRRFTIACYPSDDSMAIFEPPIRNTGFRGGVFLKRNKHRKPDGTPFVATDFAPGAVVTIYAHKFSIIDADLFTGKTLPHLAGVSSAAPLSSTDAAFNPSADAAFKEEAVSASGAPSGAAPSPSRSLTSTMKSVSFSA